MLEENLLEQQKIPDNQQNIRHAEVRLFVEPQILMNKNQTAATLFQEPMVQLGYIALFSPCFPLASLLSFVTNAFVLSNHLDRFAQYNRMSQAEGDIDIGSWQNIMEFISVICIPINISLLLFTSNESHETSPFQTYFLNLNPEFWSRYNILFFGVLIEHIILIFKSLLQAAIPDVSSKVAEVQQKNEKIKEITSKMILNLKKKTGAIDFEDLVQKRNSLEEDGDDDSQSSSDVTSSASSLGWSGNIKVRKSTFNLEQKLKLHSKQTQNPVQQEFIAKRKEERRQKIQQVSELHQRREQYNQIWQRQNQSRLNKKTKTVLFKNKDSIQISNQSSLQSMASNTTNKNLSAFQKNLSISSRKKNTNLSIDINDTKSRAKLTNKVTADTSNFVQNNIDESSVGSHESDEYNGIETFQPNQRSIGSKTVSPVQVKHKPTKPVIYQYFSSSGESLQLSNMKNLSQFAIKDKSRQTPSKNNSTKLQVNNAKSTDHVEHDWGGT